MGKPIAIISNFKWGPFYFYQNKWEVVLGTTIGNTLRETIISVI
jgi:hypothetical protein